MARRGAGNAPPAGWLCGASTGGSAALVAAARLPDPVAAVVSRGGRPDLAGETLPDVRAPTPFIVGGNEDVGIDLNKRAMAQMNAPVRLEIVSRATHLFEEPGTIEEVARLARDLVRAAPRSIPASWPALALHARAWTWRSGRLRAWTHTRRPSEPACRHAIAPWTFPLRVRRGAGAMACISRERADRVGREVTRRIRGKPTGDAIPSERSESNESAFPVEWPATCLTAHSSSSARTAGARLPGMTTTRYSRIASRGSTRAARRAGR